jgi:hypothetical protein
LPRAGSSISSSPWLAIGTAGRKDLTGAPRNLRGERAFLMPPYSPVFSPTGFWRVLTRYSTARVTDDGKKGASAASSRGHSGIVYSSCLAGGRLLKRARRRSDGGAQEQAGTVMELPGGTLLVDIGGILFLAGLWQMKRAISGDFCKHLRADIQHQAG